MGGGVCLCGSDKRIQGVHGDRDSETENRTLICPVSVFQDVLENMNVLNKEALEPTHSEENH